MTHEQLDHSTVSTRARNRRPRRIAAATTTIAVATIMLAAACAPTPSGPTPTAPPGPPTVSNFRLVAQRSAAPVVGALRFNVADPNNDVLTCRIDSDGDGAMDVTLTPCRSSDSVMVEFPTPDALTLTIEVDDGESAPVGASLDLDIEAPPAETFEITLRLDPGMDPVFQAAFDDAAQRWSQVITTGVPDMALDLPGGLVGWNPPFNGVVDDVLIDARATNIDGPGQVLGSAGGIFVRSGHWQPYYGIMEFDSADLANLADSGRLGSVILHEMGHVLGIGVSWALTAKIEDPLVNPSYKGQTAVTAWHELGGSGYVPVENQGGAGTALGHWRESTFTNELMTGWLGSGPTPLSRLTIASLADQGYGVSLGAASPYTLAGPAMRAFGAPEPESQLHTQLIPPMLGGLP